MKSLVIVSCLLAVAAMVRGDHMEQYMEILKEHIDPCLEEQNIDPTEMSKFEATELEGEDRTKLGCMKACVMKRMGVMDDTEIKVENFQEMFEKVYSSDSDKVAAEMKIATDCLEEVKDKTDKCEIAYDFSTCVMKKSKEE